MTPTTSPHGTLDLGTRETFSKCFPLYNEPRGTLRHRVQRRPDVGVVIPNGPRHAPDRSVRMASVVVEADFAQVNGAASLEVEVEGGGGQSRSAKHVGRDDFCGDLRDNRVTVGAQASHSGGSPMSQRECAGFNWPPLSIPAVEPVSISPVAVSRAGPGGAFFSIKVARLLLCALGLWFEPCA